MKILTVTAAAAALLAGLTFANAQNAPTTSVGQSPNSINKGNLPQPSGSEAMNAPSKVVGKGKFCTQTSTGALNCRFASMSACKKQGKRGNLSCVSNPGMGTVGKRP